MESHPPHTASSKRVTRSPLVVGVLMGGRGNEREVSFNSGRTVCDHLDSFTYKIVPLFQRSNGSLYILPYRFLHRGKITDFEHRLDTQAEKITWDSLKELVDFIYIAMHGCFAEDGTLQGFLEVLGIPYLGSKVYASALGMDKVMQKEILKTHGVNVPRGCTFTPQEVTNAANNPDFVREKISNAHLILPFVVKPNKEGSSFGVSMVHTQEELLPALKHAAFLNPDKPQSVLVEECIKGIEFACITITDYKKKKLLPLPPTEIIPDTTTRFFDYEQKYMPGRSTKFTPARVQPEILKKIQDTCVQVTQILGMENISRIDGFVTANNEVVIIDPNTISGMAPSSFLFRQAAELNLSHTALINHLIETELDRYGMLVAKETSQHNEGAAMEHQEKKRIAILLGGRSHEREISLESGRNIFYKLSPHKYEPIALFVDEKLELYRIDQSLLVRNSTKEIQLALKPDMKVLWNDLPAVADFVFIGLHGGEGENGSIQGTVEMLGLPYNGSSVLTSSICMDKQKTADYLKSQGFDVPRQYLVLQASWNADQNTECKTIASLAPFPLIVKPHDDGCSVLVYKVNNQQELVKAIESLFASGKQHALVEEYLGGMELTVGVIGNSKAQALPPSQAVSTKGILSIEEKFLPGAGENQTPAPLPQQALTFIQKTVERAYLALNCKGYSRIDCFYQNAQQSPTGNERLVILEFNTLPGLTPATCIFHQAAEMGLKPMEFIDLIVELGFQEHGKQLPDAKHEPCIAQALLSN